MTTSSSTPTALGQYLGRHGFAPSPGNPTWLDHGTGQQTVRVLHQPGEATLLYCLDAHSVCLYEAVFSHGTPHTVITAAIEAAIGPPPAQARRGRARTSTARSSRARGSGHLR